MLELYVYTVKIEGNDLAALSLLPPDVVSQFGLPAGAVIGEVDPRQSDMTVEGLNKNDAFLAFFHKIIGEHAHTLPEMAAQAEKVGNGPVYVMDKRSINAGEKPPFEDAIGWYGSRDGEILVESYNANPNYQPLTNAGPFQLDSVLEEKLVDATYALLDE